VGRGQARRHSCAGIRVICLLPRWLASIAEHMVFASASELPTATGGATAGLIVAYRPD